MKFPGEKLQIEKTRIEILQNINTVIFEKRVRKYCQ